MIKDVLKQINTAGVVNISEISQNVGVSLQMVDQAIAVLQSKGYLKAVTSALNPLSPVQTVLAATGHAKPSKTQPPLFL